ASNLISIEYLVIEKAPPIGGFFVSNNWGAVHDG
ncbi:hypothetical protein EDD57_16710, partial [Baia soyae]